MHNVSARLPYSLCMTLWCHLHQRIQGVRWVRTMIIYQNRPIALISEMSPGTNLKVGEQMSGAKHRDNIFLVVTVGHSSLLLHDTRFSCRPQIGFPLMWSSSVQSISIVACYPTDLLMRDYQRRIFFEILSYMHRTEFIYSHLLLFLVASHIYPLRTECQSVDLRLRD